MTRILCDAFFHMPPGHRIGPHIAVGGYQTNYGRYSVGDCYHPNGLMFLEAELAPEFEMKALHAPYSQATLFDADILFVPNPDYPLYEGSSPYRWTPADIDALWAFAERGGGVLLTVNSFLSRPDFWEENFDYERVSPLFERLGFRWDPDFMSDDKSVELAQYGGLNIGYGQGGRVWRGELPEGIKPILTFEGNIYGIEAKIGKGTLLVIGDAGVVSNGLVCFPGFENTAFVRDLFTRLKPSWADGSPQKWNCHRYGHLSASPSPHGMTADILRNWQPEGQWMDDHHYRHISWDGPAALAQGRDVWSQLPVDIDTILGGATQVPARLNWVRLDSDRPGPAFDVTFSVQTAKRDGLTDIKVLGRAKTSDITWNELCDNAAVMSEASTVDELHGVFELSLVVDASGPRAASWKQGQILYAKSARAWHYGYEIALNSASGVIVPAS